MKQPQPIFSSAKNDLILSWFIGLVLAIFSYLIVTRGFPQTDNTGLKLVLSIIPLLSMLFIYFGIRESITLYKQGRTPLIMDPPVGMIGGQVGGAILFNKSYDINAQFHLSLSSLHIYTTRSKNTSGNGSSTTTTHTDILWQEEGYAKLTQVEDYTRLEFLFDLPTGLEPSHGDFYWRLEVHQKSGAQSYNREFFLPVEEGKQKAQYLKKHSNEFRPKGVEKMTAFTLLPLTLEDDVHTLHYPIYSDKLGLQGLGIFGGIFVTIGLGILLFAQAGVASVVGFALTGVGLFNISFGLYDFLVERTISFDENSINAKVYLYGVKIKEIDFALDEKVEIGYRNFYKQKLKETKRGKVVLQKFTSLVVTRKGKTIYLAKYIRSIKAQKVLMAYFKKALKIQY